MDGRTDGGTDGWMDGQMEGQMDGPAIEKYSTISHFLKKKNLVFRLNKKHWKNSKTILLCFP